MCVPSLRRVGQGVLHLLIGDEKVTGGQTDPTCAKQYALSSSRGINIRLNNKNLNHCITSVHT